MTLKQQLAFERHIAYCDDERCETCSGSRMRPSDYSIDSWVAEKRQAYVVDFEDSETAPKIPLDNG